MTVKTQANEATREKIMLAATTVFLSHGYEQTTTRDISKLLGISQPALYHYFGDKEALFVAVIKRVGHQVFSDMSDILAQQYAQPIDQLTALTTVIVTRHPRDVFTLIHGSFATLSAESQQQLGRVFGHDYVMPITHFFEQAAVKRRENIDARMAASFYITSLSPLFGSFHALDDNLNMTARIQQLLDLIFYGVSER
ncbi:TetR/AcrR family transcriptional regulator [Leuconostoc citreum]